MVEVEELTGAEEEDTTTLARFVKSMGKLGILLLIVIAGLITTTWVHLQMQAKATNSLFFCQFFVVLLV